MELIKMMNIKRTAAVLLAAAVSAACVTALPVSGLSAAAERNELSVSADTGKTIVVNAGTGATADDIQTALVNLKSTGGTVKLVGKFNINKTIILYSDQTIDATNATVTGTADILLNAYKAENVSVKGGIWNIADSALLAKISTCSTSTFDGLTVNGGGNTTYGCFFVYCTDNTTLKNCTFKNCTGQATHIYGSENAAVINCHFSNIHGHGVYLWGSDNIKVLGNTVLGADGDGIKCCKCSSGNISGNIVKNVTLNPELDFDPLRNASRSGCGIMVMESTKLNIGKAYKYNGKTYEGNIVTNCENYGMVINLCINTLVHKTNFTDIGTNGIHNSASAATTVQNCSFKNCGGIGIFFTPGPVDSEPEIKKTCKSSFVYNNTVDNCGSFGIAFSKTDNTTVRENTVSNCADYGIFCNSVKNITISGNNITNTKSKNGLGISYTSDSINVDIDDIPLELDKTSLSLGNGESYTIKATNHSVTWTTGNSKIVTVSNGTITAKGTGTTTVTAKTRSGKTATCKVTVKNAPSTVTLPKAVLTLGVGESYKFGSVIPTDAAAATRTFRTSNSSIVKMTKTNWEGQFTAVKPGVAWVTVRLYNGKEASCKITVKAAPTSVSLNKKNLTLKVGQSTNIAAVLPANTGAAQRTFRTSNSSIVKMTKTNWEGQFTAVKPGVAWVTVRLYNGKEASCKVTVVA